MIEVPNYTGLTLLNEGKRTNIYRAKDASGASVILKVLHPGAHSYEEILRFEQEYENAHSVNMKTCVQALALLEFSGTMAIVFEDFSALPLSAYIRGRRIPVDEFLPLAQKIAHCIGDLHLFRMIHRDINPTNIALNVASGELKIFDFGIAVRFGQLTGGIMFEGTPAYLSPEQSGKMNRPVDYRADFYSAGVTFYEMLAGELPFNSHDPVELVHFHIAREPVPLHDRDSDIPRPLSDIVQKLLAKNADSRYQSSDGLLHDLSRCIELQKQHGYIPSFRTGEKDFSTIFRITSRMYGREKEINLLRNSFNWVKNGHIEMMLISGEAGIGKSKIVKELERDVITSGGFFLESTCDEFNRNTPYHCVRALIASFAGQILVKPRGAIDEWRTRLNRIGENISLINEIIPEFRALAGDPGASEKESLEKEICTKIALQQLLSQMATADSPLVLTIENINWIDSASLVFLHLLMATKEHRYLLVIGSYRDGDVNPSHPLMLTVDEINHSGTAPVQEIRVRKLDIEDIARIAADTLKSEIQNVKVLADEIYVKTGGNPFFVNEFLQSLFDDGLVQCDTITGEWTWNLPGVKAKPFTVNMVDLLSAEIRHLDPAIREPLVFAASIGPSFSLDVLGAICLRQRDYILNSIRVALDEGLLRRDADGYSFAHERIRQAALAFLTDDQQQVIHRQIGHYLLANPPDVSDACFFEVVNHLDYSVPLIVDRNEKLFLARLNLEAGRKSKESAAYRISFRYYTTGIRLLADNSWVDEYDLTLDLFLGAVETSMFNGEYALMHHYIGLVDVKRMRLADRARLYELKIQSFAAQNKPSDAVDTALFALSFLGIKIRKNPRLFDIAALMFNIRLRTLIRGPEIRSGEMSDRKLKAICSILHAVARAAFLYNCALYRAAVASHVLISMRKGNCETTPAAFAQFGAMLASEGELKSGVRFGKSALSRMSGGSGLRYESSVSLYYSAGIAPHEEIDTKLLEIYRDAIDKEQFESAGLAAYTHCMNQLLSGKNLTKVLNAVKTHRAAVAELKQRQLNELFANFENAIIRLTGGERPSSSDENTGFTPAFVSFIFNDYSRAADLFSSQSVLCEKSLFMYTNFSSSFYFAVASSYLGNDFFSERALRHLKSAERKVLSARTGSDPQAEGRCYLLRARNYALHGKTSRAEYCFEKAVAFFSQNGRADELAISCEIAAEWYLSTGKKRIARAFIRDAYRSYAKWGAFGKCAQLAARFEDCIDRALFRDAASSVYEDEKDHILQGDIADIGAIIQSSQALSGEIKYSKLIDRMMKIMMENSGASRAFLVLDSDGVQTIEAESWMQDTIVTQISSVRVDEQSAEHFPLTVINYVSRTRQLLVLDNAARSDKFSLDTYIIKHNVMSLLCLPVIAREKMAGLICLENRTLAGLFSPDRVNILEIISSQAAISIQNSKLYDQLEEYSKKLEDKVRERMREIEKVNENLLDINRLLREARIEAERDMRMASSVQTSFMPSLSKSWREWEVAISYRSMSGVSGDFYDYYERDGELCGVGLFDVSGHGISSGLITVLARSLFHRYFVEHSDSPLNEIIEQINAQLIEELRHTGNYLTGVMLKFNGSSVEYVNAAHPAIIGYSSRENRARVISGSGDSWRGGFLGLEFVRSPFGKVELDMERGDSLLLFSDCLNEGRNPEKQEFGYKRITASLCRSQGLSAPEMLDNLVDDYNSFISKRELQDDLTIMLIRKR